MSNVLVRKSNGADIIEITMLKLFGMLADESSYMDVLKRLNREKRITVELQDGSAELWRPSPATALTTQSALPLCGFTADVRLHFELPARIHCRAGSPAEAAHAIQETIHGLRGVPADFQVELDPTEVQAFIANLEVGCYSVVRDVSFNHVRPQLKLMGRTSSP